MRCGMKWAAAVLAVAGGVHPVTSQSDATAKLSRGELHRLERNAHTTEQYQELANYFRMRELSYREQAHAEMVEWIRRMRFFASVYAKYPSPVDSARNRYEYFKYEQRQMDWQAVYYEHLAATATQLKRQGPK